VYFTGNGRMKGSGGLVKPRSFRFAFSPRM
jgi:hypothetical protein